MSTDYLLSLTPVQRKFLQSTKDIFDEANNKGIKDGYVLARLVDHPELTDNVYHVLANTISKETNDLLLTRLIFNQPQSLTSPEPEEDSYIIEIETLNSNAFALNEKLKAIKRIKDIVCDIPSEDGLSFRIKLAEISDIKTIGIRFTDGNIASYKFEILFMDEKSNIISEVKGQRNSKITSLMEFYELENVVKGVDRVVFTILDKFVEGKIDDNTAKISDFVMSNDTVSQELKDARIISAVDVQNKSSEFNYANHPSLIKLRVSTNANSYPTLYEISEFTSGANNIKIYNSIGKDNVISTTSDEPILFRISNPNTAKYPDNVINNSLSTLIKKGYMKYGAYKNKFIAFKFIPLQFDSDTWSIDLVTRGGDMEEDNKNVFHAIVQMNALGFSFNRQLIENKADVFIDEVQPAFDIKLRPSEEIGIVIYQFNINETDVQYYIYVKHENDIDWKLYNSFIDSAKLVGENYKEQTICWGGLYDYIFFRNITKMKLTDITFGELVTPIRKVE